MTVGTTTTEITYVGDGTDFTFSIPFAYQLNTQIKAVLFDLTDPDEPVKTELTQDIDYLITAPGELKLVTPDVDGLGDPIFVDTPLETYQKLTIYRDTSLIRGIDYNTYQFPYPSVNTEMDKIHLKLQEISTILGHTFSLSDVYRMAGKTLTGDEIYDLLETVSDLIQNGGALPAGGVDGNYLEAGPDGLGLWVNGAFAGFSARYGIVIDEPNVRAALLKIFDFSYLAPQISLSGNVSTSVREKGDVVSAVTLTADTTKRSNDIEEVRFYRGVTLISTDSSPSPDGSTNSSYVENTDFSDTTTFTAQVDDDTSTVTSNSLTFPFVYPYYSGAGVPGKTAAEVAALTKDIRSSTSSLSKTFTSANGDVYYFAYPASYGGLTSIKDQNNFETFSDWTLTTANITGLDGNAVSYRIYEFNNTVVAGTATYTFIR